MGDVYRSRDRITEEVVALKRARRDRVVMLPRSGASGGEAIVESDRTTMAVTSAPSMTSTERAEMARLALASEFRVLSALRHPNIVSVLDYGFQENGSPFFTMRLLTDPVTIVHAARGQPLDVQLHLLFQMLYA